MSGLMRLLATWRASNTCAIAQNDNFDDYWQKGQGYGAVPFYRQRHYQLPHAILARNANQRRIPNTSAVHVHGFLTVDGTKMSKSRGTFINARTYLDHLNPEYLRYFLAAKLSNGIDDLDLNLDDFAQRVNSDLVGKVVNIASRCAGFIGKGFDGYLADNPDNPDLLAEMQAAKNDNWRLLRGTRIQQSDSFDHESRRQGEPIYQ